MSDETSASKSASPHPEAVGTRWGDPIRPERRAELQERLDAWAVEADHGRRKGPFAGVPLTGADAFWLAEQSGRDELGRVPNLHLEGATLSRRAPGGGRPPRGYPRQNLTPERRRLDWASLDQVTFDTVNLSVVDWSLVPVLGDEVTAKKPKDEHDTPKDAARRRDEFAAAVRANRVLAVTLRAQGMNEDADRYAYRAQLCQRQVLRRQRHWLRWLGALFLDTISGHGYRPLRSIATYVLVILAFAAAYFVIGQVEHLDISPGGALVTSMVSFHGRGFFPEALKLDDIFMKFVAAEALCGLLIEITFIATFTNRFFAR